jgi:hypothetical protein
VDAFELTAALRAIVDDEGIRLSAIEKAIKMPANCLSGMLNGTRGFPEKWQRKLISYIIEKNKKPSRKNKILNTRESLDQSPASKKYPLSERETFSVPSKLPPPNLSKTQQLRWHREQS